MTVLTPDLRAQLAQQLLSDNETRHGMVLRDMEDGLNDEQIAAKQNTTLENARNYRKTVEEVLAGRLPITTTGAEKRSRIYRYLLGRDLSVDLRGYVTECLNELAEVNPAIDVDEPFRAGALQDSRSIYHNVAVTGDTWPYQIGQVIKRSTLHDRMGGSRQSGISPCRTSPNVLLFTDQASGSPHGYVFDGWVDDEDAKLFLYTGEGQRGDQELTRGNAAILNHRRDRRALRLFEGAGGSNVRYVGRFDLDEEDPYIEREAPETGGGDLRRVFVFRLREIVDRAADELFEQAWEQLHSYLTQARQWSSLVEQKRYELEDFTDDGIIYRRLSTGEPDSISKRELRGIWSRVRSSGSEGHKPSTSSRGGLLALLPNIEHEARRLYYVEPESHPLGEVRKHIRLKSSLTELAEQLCLEPAYLADVDWYLRDRRQLVFYGPPGTGKTYVAERYARWFAGPHNVETIQFHPSYAYEDFIEGIRPALDDEVLRYELVPGVLKRMVARAKAQPDANFVLVVDEINRANLSRVFGELLYLLEYRAESITLPYSKESFGLPNNLYLIGTMNTADRSIALVDFALRRRFHFAEFPADAGILRRWLSRERPEMIEVADYLADVNARIAGGDFAVGFSYFMRRDLDDAVLERIWNGSILPALAEYYYNDLQRLNLFKLPAVQENVREVTASLVQAHNVVALPLPDTS